MAALVALASLGLGMAQLAGLVFWKDSTRGVVGLLASAGWAFASFIAILERRELLYGPRPKEPITLREIPTARTHDWDYDR